MQSLASAIPPASGSSPTNSFTSDGASDVGALRQQLLNDHTADRMSDKNGFGRSDLPQEILQGIGEGGDAALRKRCRTAIAGHVPRNGVEAISKKIQLSAPRPRRAADSMQEHQRRQSGIADGFVTEAAIPGFHGREIRHAGPPDKSNPPMLTGLPRLESNNFIFKTISEPSGSRS